MVARLAEMSPRPVMGLMFGEARVPAMDIALRRRIAEKGVEDRVKPMGYRTPGPFWIAACDRLVVPAVGEPFGRTLVEAMLVGTPIVAARSGGNIEALERSEEHTSELQSLMRISYAVFCLKKKKQKSAHL